MFFEKLFISKNAYIHILLPFKLLVEGMIKNIKLSRKSSKLIVKMI